MVHSWTEIDLGILKDNIRAVREGIPEATEILFVVKADAYGHGAAEVARAALDAGVRWFCVAYVEEALALRRAGIQEGSILVLGVADPGDAAAMLDGDVTPMVVSAEHGRDLSREAERRGGVLPVHVKVDTGMGRLGFHWRTAVRDLRPLFDCPGIRVEGLCSHFAAVEPAHPDRAGAQARRFREIAEALEANLDRALFKHLSSSRAVQYCPEWDFDGVRPGIMLYGYGATDPDGRFRTRPILQWKTRVMQVRDVPENFEVGYYGTYTTSEPVKLAIVALGYADGYLRTLSNRGHVLIHGARWPVVGRVSMNWIAVELDRSCDVRAGDEVVLIGEQGGESIWADELAAHCRTIPYEIVTNIRAGIERRYLP
jgi:alanine racemase